MNKIILIKILFGILVFLGLTLRFFNLGSNTIFDWDQENSVAYPAYEILVNHHLTLIGPRTGVGDLRLAPLYTYISSVFFAIFRLNPIAASISAGFISILTILVGYFFVKNIFGKNIGFYFILFYSLSPFILSIDRIPWNVNLLPLSTLFICFGIWYLIGEKKFAGNLLIGLGMLLGFSSHYTIVFWGVTLLYFFITNRRYISREITIPVFLTILAIFPLVIFNFRHKIVLGANFNTFISSNLTSPSLYIQRSLVVLRNIIETNGRILISEGTIMLLIMIVLSLFIFLLLDRREKSTGKYNILFFPAILTYFLGFTIYSGNLPGYYFSGLFPLVVIGYSIMADKVAQKIHSLRLYLLVFSIVMFIQSYMNIQIVNPQGLRTKEEVIKNIKEKAAGQKVRIIYDMDLGWSYGYNYLSDYYDIKKDQNSSLIYWISYPAGRFPGKPNFTSGEIALGYPLTSKKIYASKQIELYDGLFKLRIPRNWITLQCPGVDFDRYLITGDTKASCLSMEEEKQGILIENISRCNIWEMQSRRELKWDTSLPFYTIDEVDLFRGSVKTDKVAVVSFERERCVGFLDMSGQSGDSIAQQLKDIIFTIKK